MKKVILSTNKIAGLSFSGMDITQNKLDVIALQKYNLSLKTILESQKDTILLSVDKNYNYIYFNSAHYEVMSYAYNKKIEVGMNILDCITTDDDRNTVIQNYSKVLNGESHSTIRVYGDKNKESYESYYNPIRNDANEIIGVTAMARNISTRVKQEEALKKSEKSLKDANVTKDKLFSLISHDLRSPIGSVTSLANLLFDNFDKYHPVKQKTLLKIICKGLDSTYTLLDDLLLWSRAQKNAILFNPKKINLSSITNETIEVFSQKIANKELKINKKYPPSFNIYADKQMISTVIRNLLSNAIKFSYNKGTIELKFESFIGENNNEVHISICDYGMGISKEKINKIFSIGENTSTLGTNNEKGTGFGLIICKEFVENHHGNITIESKINEGTKIIVALPQNIESIA